MTSGGMTDGDHTIEVEFILLRDLSQMIGGERYVFKSAWPSSTIITDPAIFDAPSGDTGFGERLAQVAHVRKAVFRHPTPAMNDNGDRMRSGYLGQPQLAELIFVRAVRDALIRRCDGASQNVAR